MPCSTRAIRRKEREGAAPQRNEDRVNKTTQVRRNRLRPKRRPNQLLAGRTTAFAIRYDVRTHVASEFDAASEPAMLGNATDAIEVSSTSMNVASITAMATIHGFSKEKASPDPARFGGGGLVTLAVDSGGSSTVAIPGTFLDGANASTSQSSFRWHLWSVFLITSGPFRNDHLHADSGTLSPIDRKARSCAPLPNWAFAPCRWKGFLYESPPLSAHSGSLPFRSVPPSKLLHEITMLRAFRPRVL